MLCRWNRGPQVSVTQSPLYRLIARPARLQARSDPSGLMINLLSTVAAPQVNVTSSSGTSACSVPSACPRGLFVRSVIVSTTAGHHQGRYS